MPTLYYEFKSLLGGGVREEDLQNFLENHPEVLIGTFNQGAQGSTIFPKFHLADEFIPDFIIIGHRSGASWDVDLIEIEPAVLTEKLFNRQLQSTGRLRIAEGQVTQWQVWMERNESFFVRRALDKILGEHLWDNSHFFHAATSSDVSLMVWYRIIIARRKDFDTWANRYRTNLWRNSGNKIEIVTWDRLLERAQLS